MVATAEDPADPKMSPEETPLWGRWEGTFVADDQPPPHTELTATFTSPSGVQVTVPGFWDGGRIWRLRFMPTEEGMWQYLTFSDPSGTTLEGRQGTVHCRRSEAGSRFLRHGAVRVSTDGHYLEHTDGTPYFFLADTTWNGPMLSQEADWDTYLEDRVAKRFTGIQFVTHAPFIATYTNAEGEVAISGHAPMPVNPHFFRRIDARVDSINDRGLLAIPALAWANMGGEASREHNVGAFLPEDQLIQFIRYQVARYQAHHVLWILPGDGVYEGEEAERWKRIGRAVFGGVPHAPVTLHPAGRQWPYEAFYEESWLDVLGYQSGHRDSDEALRWHHSGPVAEAWKVQPARPVLNLEPCYEDHISRDSGERFDARKVRRACYWSLLNAPTAGLTYGGHGVWAWHERAEVPLHHPTSGVGQPWRIAKDLPGAHDMAWLAGVFTSVDWWRLRPNQALLRAQPGVLDPERYIMAATSPEGDTALIYIPVGGEVVIAMDRLAPGLAATWHDPRTGERTTAEEAVSGSFRAPDTRDWVLLMG